MSNVNFDEADYDGPDQPTHISKLADNTKMLNYSLDKNYNKKIRQQGYLEENPTSTFKNDFKVYEFFEDSYGECDFEVKNGSYICK